MSRFSRTAACALALAWLGPAPIAAQDEATDPEAETAADASAADGDGAAEEDAASPRRPPRPAPGGSIWWNDPRLVEGLSLSDAQRTKMDGFLETYREAARRDGAAYTAFVEALEAGEWSAAREALQRLSEQTVAPVRAHGELKIQALSELSEEQRATLRERYPRLLTLPWVRPAGRRGVAARGGAGRGAGRGVPPGP